MAEIRCPNCGKKNPDGLDVCQFCQTPLKPDSVLRTGQTPTKKDTGELESVLPNWLKNVRQQARTTTGEDASQAAAETKKNEPSDLLAGLASQSSNAGEEEIPAWLASINPTAGSKSSTPPTGVMPFIPEPESDFFAQFRQSESTPVSEPPQKDLSSLQENPADRLPDSAEEDELSKWFAQASAQPEEVVGISPDTQPPAETAWTGSFDSPPPQQEPASKEAEDLSWLHNLEAAARETGDLQAPQRGSDWGTNFESPSKPSGSQEDLSWLDKLGGIEEASRQAAEQPSTEDQGLDWLNNLGTSSTPQPVEGSPEKPVSASPFTQEGDLSWLNNLSRVTGSQKPAEADSGILSSPQEDLSWLNDLSGVPGTQSAPPFFEEETAQESSRQVAPFEKQETEPPNWLKSAMTESSTTRGDVSKDWFASADQPGTPAPTGESKPVSGTPQPPPFSDIFSTPGEPPPAASHDVDALFSVEMPDWLTHPEPAANQRVPEESATPPAGGEESLAPVDLPSWVQAMRPVEAVISETASQTADEPEETEGPLAGLRGVIPGMAIGSSVRPKSLSLKLQATDEQQAGAALLEKILGSETSPRALILSSFVVSQQALRLILTALFLIILGTVVGLRSQWMLLTAELPDAGKSASNAVVSLPAGANVLVVIDYEPSLAGEMEAIGGPLLDQISRDQMARLQNPKLSFVSTSPSGPALAERLMSDTGISQLGVEYRNLGFLPGGSTGVLGFVERPEEILPALRDVKFSNYAMLVLMTDHAESGRIWVEQLQARKQVEPDLSNQSLIVIASAQAGPLLQPYLSSNQITGMISGLSEGARYDYKNGTRPGIARSYWDAFGIGLMMAIALIIVGSLWSLLTGIRARRAEAEQG